MRNLVFLLCIAALPVILVLIIWAKLGSSAQATLVPDLSNTEWQFAGVVKNDEMNSKTTMVVKEYLKTSSDQDALLYSLLDEEKQEEDSFLMMFGKVTDKIPWIALKIDGKWYVSSTQTSPAASAIKDVSGNIIGMRISIITKEGIKSREVLYYQ